MEQFDREPVATSRPTASRANCGLLLACRDRTEIEVNLLKTSWLSYLFRGHRTTIEGGRLAVLWAMVKGDQTESTNIIQLAVNKKGVIRGNHYNATTEATQPLQGSVDQETQRAAWTIGDNSNVVSETGIANLTQEETEMLIHYGADRTEQWSLVRLEEPEENG